MRIATLVLLFLLPLVAAAGPRDALVETEWDVHPDGSLWVWPHPGNSPAEHEARVFRPFFEAGPDAVGEILVSGGIASWVRILLPGTMDLASQSDARYHFEKLGLGITDEEIVHRIATPPEELGATEPLIRRARLDRILAVRLAMERGLAAALPALTAIRADEAADPFLRDAAWEALSALGAPPRPFPVRELTPLLTVLASVPARADLVIVTNQARVPPWTGLAARGRELGIEGAWGVIERLGASVTPSDLAIGQIVAELCSECTYELARRFGNMRVDRSVTAVRFTDPPAIWQVSEGRFEIDVLRAGLSGAGFASEEKDGEISFRDDDGGVALTIAPSRLRMVQGDWSGPAGGELLAAELGFAGATRGDALWAHLRRSPPEGLDPPFAGLSRATLTASFEEGIRLAVELEYVHPAAARAGASALEDLRGQAPPALAGSAFALRTNGPLLSATLDVKAPTPTAALLALFEVR